MWVVAADLQYFGVGQPFACVAPIKQGVEGFRAPGLESVQNAHGVANFGIERVVEEMFQIPTQFVHEIGAGSVFDSELVR